MFKQKMDDQTLKNKIRALVAMTPVTGNRKDLEMVYHILRRINRKPLRNHDQEIHKKMLLLDSMYYAKNDFENETLYNRHNKNTM